MLGCTRHSTLAGKHSLLYQDTNNTILLGGNKSHANSVGAEDYQNDASIVYDTDTMLSAALICEDRTDTESKASRCLMH